MAIEDPNQTGIQSVNVESLDTGAALGQANASEMFQQEPAAFDPGQYIGYMGDAYSYATPTAPVEAQAYQGPIEYERPDSAQFYSYDGRILPVDPRQVLRDYGMTDPYTFDYSGETDLSYRFIQPELPSGIEAIYAPTERDPYRQDWNEAQFREVVGYDGDLLDAPTMNLVGDAELFLISLNQDAINQGFSSTQDFLKSLEINDPNYFAALSNKISESAAIMNQFGDRYRFQVSLHEAQQAPTQFRSESERIQMGMNTLRDLVSLGIYTPEQAAYIAQDPAGLLSLLNEFQTYETATPVVDDTETTRDIDTDVAVTPDAPEEAQGDGGAPAVDAQGRDIIYGSWDTDKEYPFVFDSATQQYVPALSENQRVVMDDSGRDVVVTTDPETGVVSDIQDLNEYPEFFSGDMSGAAIGAQGASAFGRTIEESLNIPVDSRGVYDLAEDYEGSPENILGMYFSDGDYGLSTSDLMDEITTGFSRTPVFDINKFRPVSQQEFNLLPPDERVSVTSRGEPRVVRTGGGFRTVYDDVTNYYASVVPKSELEYESAGLFDTDGGKNFLNDHINSIFFDLTGYSERKNQESERVFTRQPGFRQFYDDVDVQVFMLQRMNDYLSQTGKSLESVAFQGREDISSGSDASDVFDVQSFIFGNEDEGWDGIFKEMQDEFDTELRDYTSEEFDTMPNLQRFALMTAGLAHPIWSRANEEYNSRINGDEFGGLSIASSYIDQYGNPAPPDYLESFTNNLSGGGYIGGIAGGMDDTVKTTIDGSDPAALSSGEFVVPADVVSHLGDGNNENGAAKLYNFLDQVRVSKTGSVEQPAPINDGIMSNMIGDNYGF